MSNLINDGIREGILADVESMNTSNILRELVGGMKPGISESWDQRVAMADRDVVIDRLVEKRFEEACR
tara:strand:+ start:215 stop:418 length:204 start_codon:yes stop_codon:yes gene_type:complete